MDEKLELLAAEYISKVECCDECFCELWCMENDRRIDRYPHDGCELNVVDSLNDEDN